MNIKVGLEAFESEEMLMLSSARNAGQAAVTAPSRELLEGWGKEAEGKRAIREARSARHPLSWESTASLS